MINNEVQNLLTSLAAIVTIVSGLNTFFGDRHIRLSKFLFSMLVSFFIFVFMKEIICMYYYIFLGIVAAIVFANLLSHIFEMKQTSMNKVPMLSLLFNFLTLITISLQQYILNIWRSDYSQSINQFRKILEDTQKLYEIYNLMLSSSNITYTFSFLMNIVIICLCVYLVRNVKKQIENESIGIEKTLFYSIALFILSTGISVYVFQKIIDKF